MYGSSGSTGEQHDVSPSKLISFSFELKGTLTGHTPVMHKGLLMLILNCGSGIASTGKYGLP